MFLLGARIIAKQRKVGSALRRQDDHFVENLANGADEIEQANYLLSDGGLDSKSTRREKELYSLPKTVAPHFQVLPVNTESQTTDHLTLVVLSERKEIFNLLRQRALLSINEKLNGVWTCVEKTEKWGPILFVCFRVSLTNHESSQMTIEAMTTIAR